MDSPERYHILSREQEWLIITNCLAHARRHTANAVKAILKKNAKTAKPSGAYKVLIRNKAINDLEGPIKDFFHESHLRERQIL